jgi:hypothetical protein
MIVSDFCDERQELFATVEREPNHAEVSAPRKDSAEKLLGFRGAADHQQAFGK